MLYSSRIVRLPIHVTEKVNKMKCLTREHLRDHGVVPIKDYLAKQLKVSPQKIEELLTYYSKVGSLNVYAGTEDGQDTEIIDFIDDTTTTSPEENLLHDSLSDTVARALDTLQFNDTKTYVVRCVVECVKQFNGESQSALFLGTLPFMIPAKAVALYSCFCSSVVMSS